MIPDWSSVVGRRARFLATGAILVGGGIVAVFFLDIETIRDTVRTTNPLVLLSAVFVYALSWPVRGWRFEDILREMDRPAGVGFLTAIIFLSQTANLVLPARAGDGVRVYLLHDRRGIEYSVGTASLIVERIFDVIAIGLLAVVAIVFLAGAGVEFAIWDEGRTGIRLAGSVVVLAVAMGSVTVWIARRDWHGESVRRLIARKTGRSRLVKGIFGVGAAVRKLAHRPIVIGRVTASSLLAWGLDVLAGVLVLVAILFHQGFGNTSIPVFVGITTFAVCAGNLAKTVPLTQGGIGLYEAAFAGIIVGMTPLGVEIALTVAIIDHAVKNAVTVVGGVISGVLLNTGYHLASDDGDEREIEPANF